MRKTQRDRAAYHEAGHAVISLFLRYARNLRYVTIISKGNSPRHIVPYSNSSFRYDIEMKAKSMVRLHEEIIVLYAGPLAERKYFGRFNNHVADSDYKQVQEHIFKLTYDLKEQGKLMAWLKFRAKDRVNAHWSEIEMIAAALLERDRLSLMQVREVLFPEFKKST